GRAHRKKRCYDVESVFGNIKKNHGFKRFMLRGKQKVEIEMGLLAIAQNIRKKAA
ncbi:transposase, partial [Sphingobacterium sp. 1.A.5]